MSTIYTKRYEAPPFDKRQILRYVGACEADDALLSMIDECIAEATHKFSYNVCYGEFDLHIDEDIDFGFFKTSSKALKKNLSGCERAIIFAATVGVEFDRLIARYSATSPAKALIFDGLGAERIESLCDAFCKELSDEFDKEGCLLCPRFSAGYGDLPLSVQRDIFGTLDCKRKIGLSLLDSMLMSPSKSVTAIVGIKRR